ncbi:MAG TPA: galactokinase [Gemmatimonadales bacterium]|nr:galactokinase [Gemmatimonadales bacterium]
MSNPASGLFAARWSTEPAVVASAPGRANLIGEHTDYNGGPVLPFAIEHRTWVAVGPGTSHGWEAVSSLDGRARTFDPGGRLPRGWMAYLAGVARAFRTRGISLPSRLRIAVASTVPVGAGLSSSAALCVAVVRALAAHTGVRLSRVTVAELAYRAEHDEVGVQCGRMDQTIAVFGQKEHALLFDTATAGRRQLPFARTVLMVETGRSHRLTGGALNERHAECQDALATLRRTMPRLTALAQVDQDQLTQLSGSLPQTLYRRVRHVVSETRRVQQAAAALAQHRFARLGALLSEGHASLRDDFVSSCVEADAIVEWAVDAGAWGARLTGAGWGGAVLVLAPDAAMQPVRSAVSERFAQKFGAHPTMWMTRAGAGVRLERN